MGARTRRPKWFVYKEVLLTLLAIVSVGLVVFELVKEPTIGQHRFIIRLDFVVACIFLADFCQELIVARDRAKYLRHNWYLLLAAIPLTDTATEALRGLRLLRFLRLVRAGEHIDLGVKSNKPRKLRR